MTKILFICHGNICRSPLAEALFRDMVKQRGLEESFDIYSSGTSDEEHGNPIYPPMQRLLRQHNIDFMPHRANQMTRRDGDDYDFLIGMDDWNIRNIKRIVGQKNEHKVKRLLDFTDTPGEIDDPWYTERFEDAYSQISFGCRAFLEWLIRNGYCK